MANQPPTTYWDYIRVEDLLGLQGGLGNDESTLEEEELLFITVHQVFELWFKLVRTDMAAARDLFMRPRVSEQELSQAVSRLRRVTTIFKMGVKHFELVETIGTREYLAFRNKLMPASGFQSAQMRQIEVLFGLDDDERIPLGAPGSHIAALRDPDGSESSALKHLRETQADGPNLRDAVRSWLERTPIDGVPHGDAKSAAAREGFLKGFLESQRAEVSKARVRAKEVAPEADHERLDKLYDREIASTEAFLRGTDVKGDPQRVHARVAMLFIETYRELPLLAWPREVLAGIIEVEQAFLVFRQRHARMVERVIGRRVGTGGSAGVDYLDKTALEYRVFRDLWAVRTLLLRREAAPPLGEAAFYGFSAEE
ncbi:MAG: tryptophan 2,3-dioxygenase family protein [Planctomycetota bacterium]|nr:tryptophan 2,3-dioxygenase family protein [Planctomycetota bacterium]